jgi:hypothetical protein
MVNSIHALLPTTSIYYSEQGRHEERGVDDGDLKQ